MDVTPEALDKAFDDLAALVAAYRDPDRGYPSRRAKFSSRFDGDFDHLARYGEWEDSQSPEVISVGGAANG